MILCSHCAAARSLVMCMSCNACSCSVLALHRNLLLTCLMLPAVCTLDECSTSVLSIWTVMVHVLHTHTGGATPTYSQTRTCSQKPRTVTLPITFARISSSAVRCCFGLCATFCVKKRRLMPHCMTQCGKLFLQNCSVPACGHALEVESMQGSTVCVGRAAFRIPNGIKDIRI